MYAHTRPRTTSGHQSPRRRAATRSDDLLTLQRQAGNRAVAGLIAAQRTPVTVQRDDDSDDESVGGGGEPVHAGGAAGPPHGGDDGRPLIAHRDHMIIMDLYLKFQCLEGATFFENFSTRTQYAIRDLAAKYLDAWTDRSRRRIRAQMTAIAVRHSQDALTIRHDCDRSRATSFGSVALTPTRPRT